MKILIVLLCSTILFTISVDGQSEEGDNCVTNVGESGRCTMAIECNSVLNNIRRGSLSHVVCGYAGLSQIVCCPTQPESTSTARALTTPTMATRLQRISTGISAKKCNEYKEFAYDKYYTMTLLGRPATVQKVSNCAFTSVPLIVGGTIAKMREFPHMALIGFEDSPIVWACGGTLISEQFVLSAAHCAETREYGEAKYVRLGEHDQRRTDDGATIDLRIMERISHPDYLHLQNYNDIALFKLERKIVFTGAIRPACLPQQFAVPTKTALVSGWGAVAWKDNSSSVLLKVILEMFTQSECSRSYNKNSQLKQGILEGTQVCAGSHTEAKDSCQGDSGGPLQIYHPTHNCTYTIVGVTSFGTACGTIGTPGVYTRVYAYLGWIENIVWPNE